MNDRTSADDTPSAQDSALDDRVIEAQKKITSSLYDESARYNNVILIVGYAGLFSILGISKDNINNISYIFCTIMLGVSLIIYVTFEIVKITITQLALVKQAAVIRKNNAESILEFQNKMQQTRQVFVIYFMHYWAFTFLSAIFLAYLSALILLISLFVRLIP